MARSIDAVTGSATTIAVDMSTSSAAAIERLGTFPPVTAADWRNMFYGAPTPINPEAAQMVYDICWFLVKDGNIATQLTIVTFRVSLSRFRDHQMPDPASYTAWLASIASNEAHRHLEENPGRRLSSALLEGGENRDAFFLADTLAEMRADYKLAMLLRYRYNTPPKFICLALDMRPRRLARLFANAREEFAGHSSMTPTALGQINPPRSRNLPQVVEPYAKREMRHKILGYGWHKSDFPVIPERDERRAKWVTAVLTVLMLVAIGIVITNPWDAPRPSFEEPNPPAVETIDE